MISLLDRGEDPNHWPDIIQVLEEGAKISTIIAVD